MNKLCKCGSKVNSSDSVLCRICENTEDFYRFPMQRDLKLSGVDSRLADTVAKLYQTERFGAKIGQSTFLESLFSKSLFLHGTAGKGKSCTAIASMYYHMVQYNTVKDRFKKGKNFVFVSYPDLLDNLRGAFKLKPAEEKEVINKYKNADLLIIDDFGISKVTDWAYMTLYTLLNYRYGEYKQTIFTSNFNLQQVAEKLDDERIARRIADWCSIIEMK